MKLFTLLSNTIFTLQNYAYVFHSLILPPTLRNDHSFGSDLEFPAVLSLQTKDLSQDVLFNLDILDQSDTEIKFLVRDEYQHIPKGSTIDQEYTKQIRDARKGNPSYVSTYFDNYEKRGGQQNYPTIDGFTCYRTVEGTYETIDFLELEYPDFIEVVTIGESYLKTQNPDEGYDLKVLKVTNQLSSLDSDSKSQMFVMCNVHAREISTSEVCTRWVEHLLESYGEDSDITWILDYTVIHVLMQANPDGKKDDETNFYYKRKNMNPGRFENCADSDSGVDLNRNFPHSEWGGAGTSCFSCDNTFPGSCPASEPETKSIVDYVENVLPNNPRDTNGRVLSDASGIFIDVHSYGQDIFYPWGHQTFTNLNKQELTALAKKMVFFTSPPYSSSNLIYPTTGDTTDWSHEALGVVSYTLEIGYTFYLPCEYFEDNTVDNVFKMLLYASRVAKAPYKLPQGPDVIRITLSNSTVSTSETLDVDIGVSDSQYALYYETGYDTITSVKLYIDTHPYDDNSSPNMEETSFDTTSSTQSLTFNVDVSDLAIGTHTLYIQAEDDSIGSGPVYSTFFEVTS